MIIVVLIIALVVVPLVELFVIIQVANAIGFVPMLAVLIACSLFGLYLVKRLVDMHDGEIEVKSEGPGKGSAGRQISASCFE